MVVGVIAHGLFVFRPGFARLLSGAGEGNRTPDLLLTMEALCRLSYSGEIGDAWLPASVASERQCSDRFTASPGRPGHRTFSRLGMDLYPLRRRCSRDRSRGRGSMRPNRAVVLWTPVALLCRRCPASARAPDGSARGDDRRDHRSGPPDGEQIRRCRRAVEMRPRGRRSRRRRRTASPPASAPTGCSAGDRLTEGEVDAPIVDVFAGRRDRHVRARRETCPELRAPAVPRARRRMARWLPCVALRCSSLPWPSRARARRRRRRRDVRSRPRRASRNEPSSMSISRATTRPGSAA